ncbi:BadF/BadG/BcrA/BcrD ATPase family protein [Bacillus sp. JJ722]|uniref:BadF/BadG/BcrA/BcrD ATPase family protein n=1 Tax=Bacillus sp. JJ722 TaxID=3122973 RepID=UPI0030004566
MAYIIGVDGGGTKTEAVVYDMSGRKICEGRSSFGNVLINQEEAVNHVMEAIKQCQKSINTDECRFICIGLAGLGGMENPKEIQTYLEDIFHTPVLLVNDGIIAHAALLKGKDGILTISGTGSVSIGIHKDVKGMTGGWGHLLGDEGSGYWIAMQAFIKITQEQDKGEKHSPLTNAILKEIGCTTIEGLKKYIYSSTKGEIASHVPIIAKLADQGDQSAISILKHAGELLANQTLLLWRKLDFQEHVTIALKGSVLTRIQWVQTTFIKTIKKEKIKAQFITDDISSTLGCYYLALKSLD